MSTLLPATNCSSGALVLTAFVVTDDALTLKELEGVPAPAYFNVTVLPTGEKLMLAFVPARTTTQKHYNGENTRV